MSRMAFSTGSAFEDVRLPVWLKVFFEDRQGSLYRPWPCAVLHFVGLSSYFYVNVVSRGMSVCQPRNAVVPAYTARYCCDSWLCLLPFFRMRIVFNRHVSNWSLPFCLHTHICGSVQPLPQFITLANFVASVVRSSAHGVASVVRLSRTPRGVCERCRALLIGICWHQARRSLKIVGYPRIRTFPFF